MKRLRRAATQGAKVKSKGGMMEGGGEKSGKQTC